MVFLVVKTKKEYKIYKKKIVDEIEKKFIKKEKKYKKCQGVKCEDVIKKKNYERTYGKKMIRSTAPKYSKGRKLKRNENRM